MARWCLRGSWFFVCLAIALLLVAALAVPEQAAFADDGYQSLGVNCAVPAPCTITPCSYPCPSSVLCTDAPSQFCDPHCRCCKGVSCTCTCCYVP